MVYAPLSSRNNDSFRASRSQIRQLWGSPETISFAWTCVHEKPYSGEAVHNCDGLQLPAAALPVASASSSLALNDRLCSGPESPHRTARKNANCCCRRNLSFKSSWRASCTTSLGHAFVIEQASQKAAERPPPPPVEGTPSS